MFKDFDQNYDLDCLFWPVLEFNALSFDPSVLEPQSETNLICTSPFAAKLVATLCKDLIVYVPGPATGKFFKNCLVYGENTHNAQNLINLFLQHKTRPRTIVLRGTNSLDLIPNTLSIEKVPFESFTVYETKPKQFDVNLLQKLFTLNPLVLVFFSPLGVSSVFDQIDVPKNAFLCAIGETTAKKLKNYGKVYKSQKPTPESAINLIRSLF